MPQYQLVYSCKGSDVGGRTTWLVFSQPQVNRIIAAIRQANFLLGKLPYISCAGR